VESAQDIEAREVLACDESFFNALLAADYESLGTILTDDFLIVDVMSGQVAQREELLSLIGSGELRFAEVTRYAEERSVRRRDPAAVVVGRTRLIMRYQGQEASATSRYTHVLVRDSGQWRLMSAQGTPLPDGHEAVDQPNGSYRIRLARPDEVPRLREIEDEAGTLFSGLGLIDEALDVSFPLGELARLAGLGQVWVACREDGLPVGMVIASVREGAMYIEEMDVLPAHGRRGLGTRLLSRACAWAQERGYAAVTLSTFREVPWNGPFYRKHGFRDLPPAGWTPGMRAIREKEAQHGLRVEARVFMRRELDGVQPVT
jgi:GNAT superfamily N-acetyltransferase/ketosteroid isomerase-like protein